MPLYTEDYNNPLQFRILGYFKQRLFNPPLKIVNNFETINYPKSYKYLGLISNETLNMSEQMKVTMKKARSTVNLLRRIRPLIDADTASLIFKVKIIENRAQRIIGKPLPYSMKNFQKRCIAT